MRSLPVKITEKKFEKAKEKRYTLTDIIASDVVLDNPRRVIGDILSCQKVRLRRRMSAPRADGRSVPRLRNVKSLIFTRTARYLGGVQISPCVLGIPNSVLLRRYVRGK